MRVCTRDSDECQRFLPYQHKSRFEKTSHLRNILIKKNLSVEQVPKQMIWEQM